MNSETFLCKTLYFVVKLGDCNTLVGYKEGIDDDLDVELKGLVKELFYLILLLVVLVQQKELCVACRLEAAYEHFVVLVDGPQVHVSLG